MVLEPVYKFATDYLMASTGGVWVLVGIGAYLWATTQSASIGLTVLLGILGLRLTAQLYFRLRAPRVRRV